MTVYFSPPKDRLSASLDFCLLRFENDLLILVLVRNFCVTRSKTSLIKHNAETPRYFGNQGFGVTVNVVTIVSSALC